MMWLKLGVAAVLAGALWFLWHQALKVPVLKEQLKNQAAVITLMTNQKEAADKASEGYQDELRKLREARDAAPPGQPVRLCRTTAAPRVSIPAAQPGSTPAGSPTGMVSAGVGEDTQPGPDIGPDLRTLAFRADELSAQLRGCLDHDERQATLLTRP